MPILLPVGVANALNTPAAYTGTIDKIPDFNDVQIGTIYIATDDASIQTATAGGWIKLGNGGGGGNQNLDQVLTVGNTTAQQAQFTDNLDNVFIDPFSIALVNNGGNGDAINLDPTLLAITTPGYENNITSTALSLNDGNTNATIVETFSISVSDGVNFLADIIKNQIRVYETQEQCYSQLKIDVATPYCEINRPAVSRAAKYGESYIEFTDTDSEKKQYLYTNVEFNDQGVNLPANDGVLALQNPPVIEVDLNVSFYDIFGQKQTTYLILAGAYDLRLSSNVWENNYTVTLLISSIPVVIQTLGASSFFGNPIISKSGIVTITYNSTYDAFFCSNV
jgi:hypothetical protein